MTTITLNDIQDKHAEIGKLIRAYQQQQAQPRYAQIEVPHKKIQLAAGEDYIGALLGHDGSAYALILLPGDKSAINWADAKAWAADIGGVLPNRVEQALLYAGHRDKFEKAAYWSCEQHAEAAGYAWFQHFSYGYQNSIDTDSTLRARAVRRVPL